MKTPLAMMVVTLLLAASPDLCFAAETDEGPSTEAATDTDSQSSAPAETSSEQGAKEEKSDEKPSSGGDVMQNVTRHRPGACPEGPPCKSGD